jgi:hypothetical protein
VAKNLLKLQLKLHQLLKLLLLLLKLHQLLLLLLKLHQLLLTNLLVAKSTKPTLLSAFFCLKITSN